MAAASALAALGPAFNTRSATVSRPSAVPALLPRQPVEEIAPAAVDAVLPMAVAVADALDAADIVPSNDTPAGLFDRWRAAAGWVPKMTLPVFLFPQFDGGIHRCKKQYLFF